MPRTTCNLMISPRCNLLSEVTDHSTSFLLSEQRHDLFAKPYRVFCCGSRGVNADAWIMGQVLRRPRCGCRRVCATVRSCPSVGGSEHALARLRRATTSEAFSGSWADSG